MEKRDGDCNSAFREQSSPHKRKKTAIRELEWKHVLRNYLLILVFHGNDTTYVRSRVNVFLYLLSSGGGIGAWQAVSSRSGRCCFCWSTLMNQHVSFIPQVHETTTPVTQRDARTSWRSGCRVTLDSAANVWVLVGQQLRWGDRVWITSTRHKSTT